MTIMPIMAVEAAVGVATAFIIDGFLYSLLAGGSLVQLVRNCCRYRPWTVQKMIHFLLFLGTTVRAVFLILVGFDWCGVLSGAISTAACTPVERDMFYILDQWPILMFFAVYVLLVQFWAEVYYNATDQIAVFTTRVKPTVKLFISSVISIQVLFWIFYASTWRDENAFFSKNQAILNMFVFLIVTSGFIYFGRMAYHELRSVPVELNIRSMKLKELAVMTTVCTSCFITKCAIELLLSREKKQLHDHGTWFLVTIYYAFLEIVPALAILYFNRRFPLRRRPVAVKQTMFFGQTDESLRTSLLHEHH